MLINLIEIVALTLNQETYYWGMVDGGQVVYINDGAELQQLIRSVAPQQMQFIIMGTEVVLTKWVVMRKKGMPIPQDKLLQVANLLLYDRHGLYTLFHLHLDKLDFPLNKQWFFEHNPDAWFQYVFEELYEQWNAYNEEKEVDEQVRLDALDEYWQRQTDIEAFRAWVKGAAALKLRVVGDKYHLDKDQLKSITAGMPINLLLESQNDIDNRAVSVYLTDGRQIGYLRKPVARMLYERLSYENWSALVAWVDAEQWSNHRIVIEVNFRPTSLSCEGEYGRRPGGV